MDSGANYAARSYYSADDQLRFLARRGLRSDRASAPRQIEYWYDALGRRILTRSMADTVSATYAETQAPSTVTRTVWDGAQIVAEFQGIGSRPTSDDSLEMDGAGASPGGSGHPYGTVVYAIGGLDAPLAFRRAVYLYHHVIIPHANYLGFYDDGTTADSAAAEGDIVWVGNDRRTYGALSHTMDGVGWAGSVISNAQDASGLQYKRNRYYDPATGQFTQADPMGLAGGSNLYGFANGDPVNNTDPFGLCCGFLSGGLDVALYNIEKQAAQDAFLAQMQRTEAKLLPLVIGASAGLEEVGSEELQIFHRVESPTQTAEDAAMQETSGEIWGRPRRGSFNPRVQAYTGPLPEGARGIEFKTDVLPDAHSSPGNASWTGPRSGVRVEGDFAKICAVITHNTQCK